MFVYLVYQQDLANVFASETEGMDSKRQRVYQGSFRDCENIVLGARLAGALVSVCHADVAGDAKDADWQIGRGSIYADLKRDINDANSIYGVAGALQR